MGFLKNIKIKAKFLGNTLIVILMFVIALAVYNSALSKTEGGFTEILEQEVTIAEAGLNSGVLMLQARRSEKDFIMRKDMKYPPKVEESVKGIVSQMSKIAELSKLAEKPEIGELAGQITQHAGEYLTAFEDLVASEVKKGLDEKLGLQGEFRAAAHLIGGKMPDYAIDNLVEDLLQMRRYEKDYMRTKSDKYKKKLLAAVETYQADLDVSSCNKVAKQAQVIALSDYQSAANKLLSGVSTEKENEIYQVMRGAAAEMEEALDTVHVPNAMALALDIRKNEKDYLLRGDVKYVAKTIAAVETLRGAFANSGILAEHIVDTNKDLEIYETAFKSLVAEDDHIAALTAEMRAATHAVEPELEKIGQLANEAMEKQTLILKKQAIASSKLAKIVAVSALVIGILLSWLIANAIANPLKETVSKIEKIAEGDFDVQVESDSKDETGMMLSSLRGMLDSLQIKAKVADTIAEGDLRQDVQLASDRDGLGISLKKMSDNLNKIIEEIMAATEQIAAGSGQVSDSSQALSQGATESAASLEQITASMTEMGSQTATNAENASQANQLASQAMTSAETGNGQMQNMVKAMGEINDAGQSISKIIKVIDEIAFQTNLLALNAAVEAARAGRHGKGFAVVAEEVRNLAARSAKAAKETAELIEGSVEKTKNGTEIANKTADSLAEIVTAVTKVTDLVGEIASASNEQAEGISQVNGGLAQIDQVTQQNTASAEEGAAAAEELSSQAAHLKGLMSTFKVRGGTKMVSSSQPALPHTSSRHNSGADAGWGNSGQTTGPTPSEMIALDDSEFGKF